MAVGAAAWHVLALRSALPCWRCEICPLPLCRLGEDRAKLGLPSTELSGAGDVSAAAFCSSVNWVGNPTSWITRLGERFCSLLGTETPDWAPEGTLHAALGQLSRGDAAEVNTELVPFLSRL